jgi:hypothetical protein
MTTHVAKVDTTLSPKHGVIPEGHCQPGMDPTPRTSQTEQRMARLDYPFGSHRPYLKDRLARLSMLILSKSYPFYGILCHVTRLMKACNDSGFNFS